MSYPSPSDYQEAVQLPDVAFADPRLARGTVEANALGLPRAVTGAFAVVFRVHTDAGPKAVRGFLSGDGLSEDGRRGARYEVLRDALATSDLPYFVDVEWQPKGLRVNGATYPIVVMDWADGVPLDRYVAERLGEPARLRALAAAWRTLLADLAKAGLAHGDLQHGNVLVADAADGAPRLTLVDYDALHAPGMRGQPAAEVGHRNYQHPDHTAADAGPHADRFPGLVVYTALVALAADASLWERYDTGENLLFQADDFYDPDASPLVADLLAFDATRALAEALRAACFLEPAAVPTLDAVLAGEAPSRTTVKRDRRPSAARRVRPRSAFEHAVLPLLLVTIAVAVAGAWVPWLGGVAALALAVLLAVAARRYYRRPEVLRRRRLDREAAVLARWVADLEDEARALRRRLETFFDDREARAAARLAELQREALGRHLRQHFVGELDAVDGVGHRAVVRLKAAGIRDAAGATPRAVGALARVSDPTKVRIAQWRRALERRYADAVPETLPPSETQRLRRLVERERAQAEAEIRRVEAKAEAQRAELAAVEARRASVPPLRFGRYLAYLLRAARVE